MELFVIGTFSIINWLLIILGIISFFLKEKGKFFKIYWFVFKWTFLLPIKLSMKLFMFIVSFIIAYAASSSIDDEIESRAEEIARERYGRGRTW
jgi:uncharacterized membrane protein